VHCSDFNEEGERGKHRAHYNECGSAGNEVRDADEKQPREKWNQSTLAATVDAIPGTNRAEEQTQEKKRRAHSLWRVAQRLSSPACGGWRSQP